MYFLAEICMCLLQLHAESLLTAIEFYKNYLCVYGHKGLPRYHMPKSFIARVDNMLLMLCQRCPFLHTLVSIRKDNLNIHNHNPIKLDNIYHETIISI